MERYRNLNNICYKNLDTQEEDIDIFNVDNNKEKEKFQSKKVNKNTKKAKKAKKDIKKKLEEKRAKDGKVLLLI